MNISILCRYPVIHEGIKSLLKDNFENISYFSSMDNCIKSLNSTDDKSINNTKDTLLIITLFKEDLEIIDNILSIKDNYSNLKLLVIDFNESKNMFLEHLLKKILIMLYIKFLQVQNFMIVNYYIDLLRMNLLLQLLVKII